MKTVLLTRNSITDGSYISCKSFSVFKFLSPVHLKRILEYVYQIILSHWYMIGLDLYFRYEQACVCFPKPRACQFCRFDYSGYCLFPAWHSSDVFFCMLCFFFAYTLHHLLVHAQYCCCKALSQVSINNLVYCPVHNVSIVWIHCNAAYIHNIQ